MTTTRPQHTPGPWWVRRTGQNDPVVYLADVDRLKRDASDLLAACERVVLDWDCTRDPSDDNEPLSISVCRAAIAKARGES